MRKYIDYIGYCFLVLIPFALIGFYVYMGICIHRNNISIENAQKEYSKANYSTNNQIDLNSKREAWDLNYIDLAYRNTSKAYECISEIYSLTYHPVDSGPICRSYHKESKELDRIVCAAPDYVENKEQYLVLSKTCDNVLPRQP